jgi:predicted nucleic acid-binding protein
VDSSVLLNTLYETELTTFAQDVMESGEVLITSETVIDECVYVHLRKIAAENGIKNRYDLKEALQTKDGKQWLNQAVNDVLELIGKLDALILRDPEIFLVLSTAKKFGLLPHDAKILSVMLANGITRIATFDRDFSAIPNIQLLPESYWKENKR